MLLITTVLLSFIIRWYTFKAKTMSDRLISYAHHILFKYNVILSVLYCRKLKYVKFVILHIQKP